ncbi:MAG: prephenate dehydrogenase/arogenate dehydrogenase family protein, partial [Kiritimatiellae bacterium]|nr:prephenate dehydrogenase/arogenate dehydrogenase family protein [Kiritimatiellia bacterium]
KREAAGFTGGSFADMTRISASAPSLWAELIMENRNNFLKAADAFATRFDAIVSAVRAGDKTLLASTLEG